MDSIQVPVKGGRDYIYNPYHLLREPETTIDCMELENHILHQPSSQRNSHLQIAAAQLGVCATGGTGPWATGRPIFWLLLTQKKPGYFVGVIICRKTSN